MPSQALYLEQREDTLAEGYFVADYSFSNPSSGSIQKIPEIVKTRALLDTDAYLEIEESFIIFFNRMFKSTEVDRLTSCLYYIDPYKTFSFYGNSGTSLSWPSMLETTDAPHTDFQYFLLEDLFILRRIEEVNDFIAKHQGIQQSLLEAYSSLIPLFKSDAVYVLEVVYDPSAEVPDEKLFVNIQTSLSIDEAFVLLDKFDEDWYMPNLDSVGHLINFNLEIV